MKWSDFSQERKLVSIHVPKTGGKTFRSYLESVFGEKIYIYKVVENMGRVYLGKFLKAHCVHGHFRYADFDGNQEDHVFITWMRDPIQQAFSAYHYFQRFGYQYTQPPLSQQEANQVTFEAYLRYYPGQGSFLGESMEPYTFIGITEHYPESIQLFQRMFGIDIPFEKEKHVTNVNPYRQSVEQKYKVEERKNSLFCEQKRKDLELYKEAKEKFTQLCDEYGVALPSQSAV